MSEFEYYVPVLTLVDEKLMPLTDRIQDHLQWLKGHGVTGLLVMGTTGEFPNFTPAQRKHYLEAVLAVNPSLNIMVQIGSCSMAETLELQQHAVSLPGVNQILWMPPFYFPESDVNGLQVMLDKLIAHQPTQIPFLLYHQPRMSQVAITPELLNHPRIQGLKDSAGDFERIIALRQQFPDKAIYIGTDSRLTQAKALGCTGVICGMANVFPDLVYAAIHGNLQAEQTITRLRAVLDRFCKIPAMKACLNQLHSGASPAAATLPFRNLLPDEVRELQTQIHTILEAPVAYAD